MRFRILREHEPAPHQRSEATLTPKTASPCIIFAVMKDLSVSIAIGNTLGVVIWLHPDLLHAVPRNAANHGSSRAKPF